MLPFSALFFQPPLKCFRRSSGFPRSTGYLFRSSRCAVHVSTAKITRNRMKQGPGCTLDASSLQCCSAQAALTQKQPYVAEHCLDEQFSIEVLVISIRFDQQIFPVPSCNTPYLLAFLEGRLVDRPSLIKRRS